jgi:hypothetical protein
MNTIVRNILAVIAGIVAMFVTKMAMITLGMAIFPPPPGSDMSTPEGIAAALPQMGLQHFIAPFLDHALGSLVGGLVAALVAGSHKMIFALAMGVLHLIGGVAAVYLIPAPLWFEALDLIVCYIPMAWLGGKLGNRGRA